MKKILLSFFLILSFFIVKSQTTMTINGDTINLVAGIKMKTYAKSNIGLIDFDWNNQWLKVHTRTAPNEYMYNGKISLLTVNGSSAVSDILGVLSSNNVSSSGGGGGTASSVTVTALPATASTSTLQQSGNVKLDTLIASLVRVELNTSNNLVTTMKVKFEDYTGGAPLPITGGKIRVTVLNDGSVPFTITPNDGGTLTFSYGESYTVEFQKFGTQVLLTPPFTISAATGATVRIMTTTN